MQNNYNLHTIVCLSEVAPTISSSTFNINSQAVNRVLYIPENSVGYDTEYWSSQLIERNKFQIKSINEKPTEKKPCVLRYATTDNTIIKTLDYLGDAKLVDIQKIDNKYNLFYDDSIYTIYKTIFQKSKLQSIELPETIKYLLSNTFYYCTSLSTITCKAMTPPTIQSDTFQNVGTKVPSGTPKVLRVPEGASGYDSGNWKTYVIDKGYTLEYIPLSEL